MVAERTLVVQTVAANIQTIDPSTGELLEQFDYTPIADVNAKIDRAVESQREWRMRTFAQRDEVLRAVAAALRARDDELASTATREMGKPIAQSLAEIEKCARCCDFYAENAERFLSNETVDTNASRSFVAFRPLGVILAVMPWNFPFWQVFRAAAPALMAGNVMILKHASNVSRCALQIEEVFIQSGAPEGLFTTFLLHSDRVAELIADPRIAAATLTGSEGAGVSIASAAGRHLKKTVLELGGSDPFIVLNDADLPAAVDAAIRSRFQNAGQSCIAAKRFIVEGDVYHQFVDKFAAAARAQTIGDPMDRATQLGPLAREDLRDALHRQVQASAERGARIVTGGKAVQRPGFFYEPTILADVADNMPAFTEETFGPAAAVTPAKDAASAVTLANDTMFGLGATIWSRDTERATKLAAQLESGSVFINGVMASDPRLPFGGVKRSGYGRELSHHGIHEFVNIQTVWVGPAK
ncbi:MAG: NAD-dependent succinate-semialdehyde dehydrogenase [Candidatus Eremiobacteraeota bacterium]|nr:NAD-dependent succinate-semialdehyde dehydrogenase [Candidatus Eremiobacteraeota bacterium]